MRIKILILILLFGVNNLSAKTFSVFKVQRDEAFIDLTKSDKIANKEFIISRLAEETHPVTNKIIKIKMYIGKGEILKVEDDYAIIKFYEDNKNKLRVSKGDICEFFDPRKLERIIEKQRIIEDQSGVTRQGLQFETYYTHISDRDNYLFGQVNYRYFTNYGIIVNNRSAFGFYRGTLSDSENFKDNPDTDFDETKPAFFYGAGYIDWGKSPSASFGLTTGIYIGLASSGFGLGGELIIRIGRRKALNVTAGIKSMKEIGVESHAALNSPITNNVYMSLTGSFGNFPAAFATNARFDVALTYYFSRSNITSLLGMRGKDAQNVGGVYGGGAEIEF